jgi:hypothetical protein
VEILQLWRIPECEDSVTVEDSRIGRICNSGVECGGSIAVEDASTRGSKTVEHTRMWRICNSGAYQNFKDL